MVESVLSLSRIRAIVENPDAPEITTEYVDWAESVSYCSVLYFEWLLKRLATPSRQESEERFAERVIKRLKMMKATKKSKAVLVSVVVNYFDKGKFSVLPRATRYGVIERNLIRNNIVSRVGKKIYLSI